MIDVLKALLIVRSRVAAGKKAFDLKSSRRRFTRSSRGILLASEK